MIFHLKRGIISKNKSFGVEMKKEKLRLIKKYFLIVFGTAVLSLGTALFIIPFELVVGGVSGFSIVIYHAVGGAISVDTLITLLTWGLFFLGLLILGKDFAIKTLLSTVLYPFGVTLFSKFVDQKFLGGFFDLTSSTYPQLALLLSAIMGGLLVGCGCALTFLGGGSTGGVDIPAFIICKYFSRARSSAVIFCIDAVAVALGVFIIGDMVLAALGVISALVSALTVDKIFLGGSRAFVAQIISNNCGEIGKEVIDKLHRTATVTEVVGVYSGERKKQLSVIFTRNEYAELMSIVNKADKKAFITVHRAHEIGGEGWTYK